MNRVIKVGSTSPISRVAGAIAKQLRVEEQAILQAIGAGAVNQAIKALVIARNYLAQDQLDLSAVPEFSIVEIDGVSITAIRFLVHKRACSISDYETPRMRDYVG